MTAGKCKMDFNVDLKSHAEKYLLIQEKIWGIVIKG